MVPDPSTAETRSTATNDGSNTLLNAVIGAVAGIVLSFIPLSTVLGGAVAGYLEADDTETGLRVGALAGLIMLIPFALFGLAFMMFFLGFGTGGAPLAFGFFAFIILLFGAVYTVGLSAVGGYLGVYLKHEL